MGLDHWAWQPPAASINPRQGSIDEFLHQAQAKKQLTPGPRATPEVLARRLSLVLTGLPPTVEQARRLRQAGDDDQAFEALVDEYLASPTFGEHWARHWLDVVRYADGKGHEYDFEIPGAWRYRDYVVRALNADVPYDVFLREHIAGDRLPEPRMDEKNGRNESMLATMWWQLGEGVTAPVDLANDQGDRLDNQVDTLGRAFLGVSFGCARCHDHKADPLSTADYYALCSIMQASPTVRQWSNQRVYDDARHRLQQARAPLEALSAAQPEGHELTTPVVAPLNEPEVASSRLWVDFTHGVPSGWQLDGALEWIKPAAATLGGRHPALWSGTWSEKLPAAVRSPVFTIESEYVDVLVTGKASTLQLIVENYQLIRAPIYDGLKSAIDGEMDGWRWHRIAVGRWKGKHAYLEVFTGEVHREENLLGFVDSPASAFGLRAVAWSDGEARPAPPRIFPAKLEDRLTEAERTSWDAQRAAIESTIPEPERFLGTGEFDQQGLPVFFRGNANQPRGEKQFARWPRFLGGDDQPLARQGGSGRLELADQLLSEKNPLTARVIVNRLWHHCFGRGLVETVDDFGVLGARPSDQALLDWLALRFVNVHRWSMKKMIREMILTEAWKRAAGPAPEADPHHETLSRQRVRRLTAEMLRDSLLHTAGTLQRQREGPPIPVPTSLVNSGSGLSITSGPIDGENRRSLYLATRRNFAYHFFTIFDKPPTQGTFGRRHTSNVPAQALTLLNDPLVHLQAQKWASRIMALPLSTEEKISLMHEEAFARPARAEEITNAQRDFGSLSQAHDWEDLALSLFNSKEFLYYQ